MSQSLNADQASDGLCPWFVAKYSDALALAFKAMIYRVATEIAATGKLAVSVEQHELHPHTCKTMIHGIQCLNESLERSGTLQQRMIKSRVDHVKWVAAVLLNDSAASRALLNLINGKVRQQILKQFQGHPHAVEAVDDLPSRLFLPGENGEPRISGFRGEASLDTWLVGIGVRMAINSGKGKAAESISTPQDGHGTWEPSAPPTSSSESTVADIMKQLASAVIATISTLSDQEVLVFKVVYVLGRKPSEAAGILSVSRPRVSQILLSIREKIAAHADGVIRDVAEASNVDETVIVELLSGFLENMKLAESEQDWTPLDWKRDALDLFLKARFGVSQGSQKIEQ